MGWGAIHLFTCLCALQKYICFHCPLIYTTDYLVAGGDNISVTKGVVSRVEPTQYVHGATQLLAIQIDAAINPGNSGGPAIMGEKVAGVAFQNLSGAENIGWVLLLLSLCLFDIGMVESIPKGNLVCLDD